MVQANKIVGIETDETSGVDHPAHLHEGFLVMKNASGASVDELLGAVRSATDTQSEEKPMADDATQADLEKARADLELAKWIAAENEHQLDLAKADEPADESTEIEKALAELPDSVREHFEKQEGALAQVTERLEKAEIAKRTGEWVSKAKTSMRHLTTSADELGKALRKIEDLDPETAAEIARILTAASEQVDASEMFEEIGSSVAKPPAGSATEQIHQLAEERAAADGTTREVALAKVAQENRELYEQHAQAVKKGI